MDAIFMNSENSRTSEYHVLVLKLTDKLDLKRGQKSVALSNLSIYYTLKNIKSSYNNNKFKISAPTWSGKFELPDGSYSISNVKNILSIFLKNIVKMLITHQSKYMETKLKIELDLTLKQDIILNF